MLRSLLMRSNSSSIMRLVSIYPSSLVTAFRGKGAIDAISERLEKELPGLRGFSARNLRNMRTFYEEWAFLDNDGNDSMQAENILADTSANSSIFP